MPFSKKASLIVVSILTFSSITILSSLQDGLRETKKDGHTLFNGIKEFSKEVLEAIPQEYKPVIGVATLGLGGAFFVSKLVKNVAVTALYCGGLMVVTSASRTLLQGTEIEKTIAETTNSLKNSLAEILITIEPINKETPKK